MPQSLSPEKITIGILTQSEERYMEAMSSINANLFEVVQLSELDPDTQAESSIESAVCTAREAAQEHGIPVIIERYAKHSGRLSGISDTVIDPSESTSVDSVSRHVSEDDPSSMGSTFAMAILCDAQGKTVGTTCRVERDQERFLGAGQDVDGQINHYQSSNFSRLSDFVQWRQNRIIYLTGPHASGKTEAANLLEAEHGYPYFDLGPAIRQSHADQLVESSLEDWIKEQEEIFGINFTNSLLAGLIMQERQMRRHPMGITIVGSRSIEGINYLSESLSPSSSLHIHLDVAEPLLLDRYCAREEQELTRVEFAEKLDVDTDMGLTHLENFADIIIQNNGDKESFYALIGEVIARWEFTLPSDDLFYID